MAAIVDWLRCYTVSNSNVEGRGTTSRAQEWALVKHSGMSCPRRPMSWRSKRLCWEGAPGGVAGRRSLAAQLCRVAHSLRFYGHGVSFRVFSDQSLWQSPSWRHVHCSAEMDSNEKASRGDQTRSFWPFPDSSGWWWLISSVLLARTSCCKITHTDGYDGAWPGWAVWVSVFPLTGWVFYLIWGSGSWPV